MITHATQREQCHQDHEGPEGPSYDMLNACGQSHYREVLRREIFMEEALRFWLDLGRLALLIWADYEQLLGGFFKFSWAKKINDNRIKNVVASALKSYIK